MSPAAKSLMGISNVENFYFFVKVKRHNFSTRSQRLKNVSGHLISIEPAFTLYNLLPLEFRYRFISSSKPVSVTGQKKIDSLINGKIDSNKCSSFHNINCANAIDLYIEIDNFRMARVIEINPAKHLTNLNAKSKEEATELTADRQQQKQKKHGDEHGTEANQIQSNRKLTVLRRVNFFDEKNRPLFLIARLIFKIGSGLNLQNNVSLKK